MKQTNKQTNKLKNYLSKLILYSFITLTLSNCSQETLDINENRVDAISKNEISFKTFKSRTGLYQFKKTISLPNESINIQGKNIHNHNIFKEFIIDTSYIKQCVVQHKTTYSFKIIPKIITSSSIFNLIVHNKNGVWETSIIEMIPSKHNLKDLISGSSKQFKGKMRLLYQSHPSQKDKNNYFERSTVIGTGYTTIFVQISHCTGTEKCASGTCDRCNLCVSYNSYRVPVTGEAIEALEESPTFSSEGGGGGSSNIDPSGYVIDPNLFDLSDPRAYLILQKAEITATFWADLLDEQKQWATLNHDKYSAVLNYYLDNTSPEGKAFVKELIEDMVNFPTSEGNDGNASDFNYDDYSNVQTQSQSLPGRNSFYNAFPKYGTSGMKSSPVYQLIGGTVYNSHINEPKKYANACALRVSRALNYSGNPIPVFYNNAGKQRTQKGGDNKNYILDAASLLAYMKKTFPNSNPIHLINRTETEYKKAINGKWGIYIMLPRDTTTFGASGHADFWSNTGCLSGCHFDKAKEIYFWELF